MLTIFNEQTKRLSDDELNIYLPAILNFLRPAKGKDNAITNGRIRREMEDLGLKIGAARVRKIINYIRVEDELSCLIASNRGYYISDDPDEIRRYIESLRGRVEKGSNRSDAVPEGGVYYQRVVKCLRLFLFLYLCKVAKGYRHTRKCFRASFVGNVEVSSARKSRQKDYDMLAARACTCDTIF